ncbi:MAG: hypothetical protein A4E19_16315 [Nitrospira sp. SG-bin1]|nr:MAG: hypothetical protein A4E19_16315 [Nitrospira sp. SG-bin1]
MVRVGVIALFLLCLTVPVWAADTELFNPDQPFEQAMTRSFLRSLVDQAIDRFEDHVEISGNLASPETKSDQEQHLGFKFYPEGKSKSTRHFAAESWFRIVPESGHYDWHFQFRQPEDRSKKQLPPQMEAPL